MTFLGCELLSGFVRFHPPPPPIISGALLSWNSHELSTPSFIRNAELSSGSYSARREGPCAMVKEIRNSCTGSALATGKRRQKPTGHPWPLPMTSGGNGDTFIAFEYRILTGFDFAFILSTWLAFPSVTALSFPSLFRVWGSVRFGHAVSRSCFDGHTARTWLINN